MQQMEILLVILLLSREKFHAKQNFCAKQLYEVGPCYLLVSPYPNSGPYTCKYKPIFKRSKKSLLPFKIYIFTGWFYCMSSFSKGLKPSNGEQKKMYIVFCLPLIIIISFLKNIGSEKNQV